MIDFKALESIRNILEEIPDFPEGKCLEAAKTVQELLGYDIFEGVILTEHGPQHHVFNYDSVSKSYVDLSADQFEGISLRILITPETQNNLYRGIRKSSV